MFRARRDEAEMLSQSGKLQADVGTEKIWLTQLWFE